MPKNKSVLILLGVIILAAALFRFVYLQKADLVSDESINAFRSIGYLDFFATTDQTTTLSWFTTPPWWTKLSFHDHPLLNFALTYLSLKTFGQNPLGVRFFPALAGVLSVFLIYLIGKNLFDKKTGLIAGAISAVNVFLIWVSREGLQESVLIFFMLLSLNFFILSLKKEGYLYLATLFLGLALLTKYTAVFLVPVYLIIFFINKKEIFKNKRFYLNILILLIIISPILIYNVLLFKNLGHFDLQISYVFGLDKKVPGWENLPGKSDLSLFQRTIETPISLVKYLSPIFLLFLTAAFLYLLKELRKKQTNLILLSSVMMFLTILIILIGPQKRFMTMFVPFFALTIAGWLSFLSTTKYRKYFALLPVAFVFFEAGYSFNTEFLLNPIGLSPYTFSYTLQESRDFLGLNNLDSYLQNELKGKVPAIRFAAQNQYLEKIINQYFEEARGEEENVLIVYDRNIRTGPDSWYLERYYFYHGWPIVNADNFLRMLKENGQNYYTSLGFKKFYFIQATPNTFLIDQKYRTYAAEYLGSELQKQGIKPDTIYNYRGQPAFFVYKVTAP